MLGTTTHWWYERLRDLIVNQSPSVWCAMHLSTAVGSQSASVEVKAAPLCNSIEFGDVSLLRRREFR